MISIAGPNDAARYHIGAEGLVLLLCKKLIATKPKLRCSETPHPMQRSNGPQLSNRSSQRRYDASMAADMVVPQELHSSIVISFHHIRSPRGDRSAESTFAHLPSLPPSKLGRVVPGRTIRGFAFPTDRFCLLPSLRDVT
jgi:hypothetical protein